MNKRNVKQGRSWMLTLKADDYPQDYVEDKLSNYVYAGQLEAGGKTGYLHWQIYIENENPIKFITLKNSFPTAHIEPRWGTKEQALDYVTKENTYAGIRIGNGLIDPHDGRGEDPALMEELFFSIVHENKSVDDLLVSNPGAARMVGPLRAIETARDNLLWKTKRRDGIQTHYIWGDSRTGKTLYVSERFGADAFRVTNYKNPFDFYRSEPVLVLDEFASKIPFDDMLNLCDRYPMCLKARNQDRWAAFETVYILSNLPLEKQYEWIQKYQPERWKALVARIDTVNRMEKGGRLILEDEPKKRFTDDSSTTEEQK